MIESSLEGKLIKEPPLAAEKIRADRKVFYLDLKENHRGRVLKITEDLGGHRNTIMLPASAFWEFAVAFARLVEFERRLAPPEVDP